MKNKLAVATLIVAIHSLPALAAEPKTNLLSCQTADGQKVSITRDRYDTVRLNNESGAMLGWAELHENSMQRFDADAVELFTRPTELCLPIFSYCPQRELKIDLKTGEGRYEYESGPYGWNRHHDHDVVQLRGCVADRPTLEDIQNNIPVDEESYSRAGNTPRDVLTAISKKDFSKLRCLVNQGVDVNYIGRGRVHPGNSSLMIAAFSSQTEAAQLLLSAGANADYVGGFNQSTALHYAIEFGNDKTVELLANAVRKIDARDAQGFTTFLLAVRRGRPQFAQSLIEQGANKNARVTFEFASILDGPHFPNRPRVEANALMLAASDCSFAQQGIDSLMGLGINVLDRNATQDTAIHFAAAAGCNEYLTALIAAGGEVSAKNTYGETPLSLARYDSTREILKNAGAQQ